MKIGIAIPCPDGVDPDFAISNLTQIISYTKSKLPDLDLVVSQQKGVRTDRNRNVMVKNFLEDGVDAILHLDADMIFPEDILVRYLDLIKLKGDIYTVGCLYFKRSDGHKPIGYVDSGDPELPFRPVMPQMIKKGVIYEVTGLGYGGLFVPSRIYRKLGKNWATRYGENFHNPDSSTKNLTHDLEFCNQIKSVGEKIYLHGSVRPQHIGKKYITELDFYENFPPRVPDGTNTLVIMPSIDKNLAIKAAEVLEKRAGASCQIQVVLDQNRMGFVHTANDVFKKRSHLFTHVVYTAQDAFVGENWLKNALITSFKHQAGLVSFNDGKWNGQLASFGIVETSWAIKNYEGNLFYPGYHSHYADTELTQLAKNDNCFAHAKDAIMLEIDYNKASGRSGGVVKADKKLYKKRIKKLVNKKLVEEFS